MELFETHVADLNKIFGSVHVFRTNMMCGFKRVCKVLPATWLLDSLRYSPHSMPSHTVWTVHPLTIAVIPCNVCWCVLRSFEEWDDFVERKLKEIRCHLLSLKLAYCHSFITKFCIVIQLVVAALDLSNVHWHCDVHQCQTWGCEDSGVLGCEVVSLGEWFPTFRWFKMPSSTGG
jgi:hypothetical protein